MTKRPALTKSTAYLKNQWAGLPAYDDVAMLCDAYDALLSSLTPPTPEEVAQWAAWVESMVGDFVPVDAVGRAKALDSLARLRDWAARAQGLEADTLSLAQTAEESEKARLAAESERDAARQEAETLRAERAVAGKENGT